MKVAYKFVDGHISVVEVDDEIGAFILDSRREDENLARKERAHNISLDAVTFEGEQYGKRDSYPSEDDSGERMKLIRNEFDRLPEPQKRRLTMYINGMTLREIACVEDVSFQSVGKSICAAQKKFEKFRKRRVDKPTRKSP